MMKKTEQIWAFAYGSLMWRPGFAFAEKRPALLHGYHRAACVYSITYRGTSEEPGLVVGLARGGSCRGIAYRVEPEAWEEARAYLDSRELVTGVYLPKWLTATLEGGEKVKAYAYVADPDHRQYAGSLSLEEAAAVARRGVGREGRSRDYIANVIEHLDEFGIRDGAMHRLLGLVDGGA